jgi:hypothetical protein
VTRLGYKIRIDPRFDNSGADEPEDSYLIILEDAGGPAFLKTDYRVYRFSFPPWRSRRRFEFTWARGKLKPWKTPRKNGTSDALR